ncbi:hypothetical protein A5320_01955 [Rheinheimera sp. SA_1]|nr:hypothetical protein A5320_01955 [Rheinheimera sp. SA_1]
MSGSTLANREFAQAPQTIDFIAGFRAIRGRLFFGFFLLAKQKKETRQRRNAFKTNSKWHLVNRPDAEV